MLSTDTIDVTQPAVSRDSGVAKRLRSWRVFSQLATRDGRLDPFLFALAFGWAHECCGHPNWVFSYGCRGLAREWTSLLGNRLKRCYSPSATLLDPAKEFDILVVPQFATPHYAAPCFALTQALLASNRCVSVAILKPSSVTRLQFLDQAQKAGCNPDLVEVESPLQLAPFGVVWHAARRFYRLLAVRGPQEFVRFFRASPARHRFLQLFSNQLMFDHVKKQLRRWKVRKVVTMNEQWFPGNLIVAAANELGIETHQILHGGMATRFYVPFQSQYLWPEYEVTAKQLVNYGIDPARLKIIPGLQVASLLSQRRLRSILPSRSADDKLQILVLAQYHGYSRYGQNCFRDALEIIFKAVALREHSWKLVIRPHPSDGAEDLDAMKLMLARLGIAGIFADASEDLADQAAEASLVVTATSSAIFVAVAGGTPACVIWGSEQAEAYGSPSLEPEWVIEDVEDLLGVLDRLSAKGGENIASLAWEQVQSLGLTDWVNSPKRASEELLRDR